jgi:hypothetical protein
MLWADELARKLLTQSPHIRNIEAWLQIGEEYDVYVDNVRWTVSAEEIEIEKKGKTHNTEGLVAFDYQLSKTKKITKRVFFETYVAPNRKKLIEKQNSSN